MGKLQPAGPKKKQRRSKTHRYCGWNGRIDDPDAVKNVAGYSIDWLATQPTFDGSMIRKKQQSNLTFIIF
jgi:hypothetical protein